MKKILATLLLTIACMTVQGQSIQIVTNKKASDRERYAAEYLQKKLKALNYSGGRITLSVKGSGPAEGYTIRRDKKGYAIEGNDATGVIYGAVELADQIRQAGSLSQSVATQSQPTIKEQPAMVMRGTCIGLQKTVYLPGHAVYEYPYTPENFPWFYDKEAWIRYLDMMVENKFNSLYLWNGHPFASLVKLKDYPFALEVDEETFKKNEEIFSFLTHEADRRGIWVIQMFYNIILSKPFADHYGLKTQDRHRPITPLISDYTRKSIAAFIEKYPNVGLLVCLGEAMATIDDDVTWMKETIIPGIKDGLAALGRSSSSLSRPSSSLGRPSSSLGRPSSSLGSPSSSLGRSSSSLGSPSSSLGRPSSSVGRSSSSLGSPSSSLGRPSSSLGSPSSSVATQSQQALPPIVLRSHDTDGPLVLKESLPLYPNIYTMSKYTGESLTTYEPGGPWGETHRQLAAAAPVHIDNVHILANLEPWRWSSPAFIQKTVQAMHRVHHSKGLHLYPQASYWDWPYTADKLPDGQRLLQLDRDWMWYQAWGRYAWNDQRDSVSDGFAVGNGERSYWKRVLADYYGIDTTAATHLLAAYDEAGEIAPKLLRRFGITEGNRQTLLLGMTMGELVNPYKYTIYPGFYESCGPEGEKLIEYIEKEYKGLPHVGELPLDIVDQCVNHGDRALVEMGAIATKPTRHADEYERVWNDFLCYASFAKAFQLKVRAAAEVLRYKWTQDISHLETAEKWLEQSLSIWYDLSRMTDQWYLYANSMQTAQRRIPVGGDNGKMKTWSELAVVYQAELDAFKENIEKLKHPVAQADVLIRPLTPAPVQYVAVPQQQTTTLQKGAILFENRPDTPVDSVAPELVGLQALVLNRDTTRIVGTTVAFECDQPVKVLVGLFKDDDPKWAKAPKLEIDATGNEYGQAEPVLTNAISIVQMPKVNIHAYSLPAGRHTLRLPKGILMVAGLTSDDITPRDCGLNGPSTEVDWLFQK